MQSPTIEESAENAGEKPPSIARPRKRHPDAAVRIEARRRRKKERIVAAAHEVLEKSGPHGMSLRAVAREAGFAPATLYEYFDSHFALLDALADGPRAELRRFLDAATADSAEMASDLMIRLAIAYVRFAQRHPKEFRLLFETLAPQQTETRSPFDLHPVMQPLVNAARAGQLTGEIHTSDDPERIAWGLWALAHGLATLRAGAAPAPADGAGSADVSVLQAYVRGWAV